MAKSFIDKLRFNKLTSVPVSNFEGNNFSISFPPNWRRLKKLRNFWLLVFINLKDNYGILHISHYTHEDPMHMYDIEKAKLEIEERGYKPIVHELTYHKALIYSLNYINEHIIQYIFETGSGPYRLLATLTFNTTDNITKDKCFEEMLAIMSSLKFKNYGQGNTQSE